MPNIIVFLFYSKKKVSHNLTIEQIVKTFLLNNKCEMKSTQLLLPWLYLFITYEGLVASSTLLIFFINLPFVLSQILVELIYKLNFYLLLDKFGIIEK